MKGLRVAGAKTLEQANAYLETKFLPWWNKTLAVVPASSDDAHRPLGKEHSLAASLSYVETRQVSNDYTIQFDNQIWQIARFDIRAGLRGGEVRFGKHYLAVTQCHPRRKVPSPKVSPKRTHRTSRREQMSVGRARTARPSSRLI